MTFLNRIAHRSQPHSAAPSETMLLTFKFPSLALLLLLAASPIFTSAAELTFPAKVTTEDIVLQLLNTSWDNNRENRANADALIGSQPIENYSAEEAYAIGLLKINHSEYLEAIKWMDAVVLADEANLRAHRALIWLLARTRQPHRALDELITLVESIDRDHESFRVEEREEITRFAGRLMGFFAGPANDGLARSTFDEQSRRVLSAIDDELLDEFNESREIVLEQFNSTDDARAEEIKRSTEEAAIEKERLINELEDRRVEAREQLATIGPMLDELRDEASLQLESIQSRGTPLESEIRRLDGTVASLDTELALISSDINRLERRAFREQDLLLRDRLRRQADSLRITARRIESDLINADRRRATVIGQHRQIVNEFQSTEARFNREIGQLESRQSSAQQSLRRIDGELTRTRRNNSFDQRRSRSMSAEIQAIATYDEFPLEEERRRLLRARR